MLPAGMVQLSDCAAARLIQPTILLVSSNQQARYAKWHITFGLLDAEMGLCKHEHRFW